MSILSYIRPRKVLLHIPKTGGTWLGDLLVANRRWYETPLVRQLSHGNSLARTEQRFGQDVRFGFVFRDPLARLHSAFDSRRNCSRPTRNTPWTEAERLCFERFDTFDAFAISFGQDKDHPDRLGAEAAMRDVGHFRRGLEFFFESPSRLNAARHKLIFCAELPNIHARIDDFSNAYGIRTLHVAPTARSHSSAAFRTPLTDAGRAAIKHRLTREYELFRLCQNIELDLHGKAQA